MYIRKRVLPGPRQTINYQLLKSVREGDRVRQRFVANLGSHPTIPSALKAACEAVADLRMRIGRGLLTKRQKESTMRRLAKAKKTVAALESESVSVFASVVSNRHIAHGEFDTTP